MNRIFQAATGFALLALALSPIAVANDEVTMEGSFVWVRDSEERTGDLTAVLTPESTGEWTVAFHFVWEETSHTYMGTASGSLDEGPLTGAAESDDPDNKILFRFSGESEDGSFSGTHSFVQKDGSLVEGGTLALAKTE